MHDKVPVMNLDLSDYVIPVNSFPLTVNGQPIDLSAEPLQVGDVLEDVLLDKPAPTFDTVVSTRLSDFAGYTLIYALPSLDTPVCTRQTQELQVAAELFPDVNFVVISWDTPFALERFCIEKDITTVHTMSDARSREFGLKHGLFMLDYGLLARAVIIVNDDLEVVHVEYVSEVTDAVDLLNAFAYLRDQGLMIED
jgi:thiol peroxidase